MRLFLSFFALFLLSFAVSAQVCTGSLGDPTVTINFGAGSGIGPPLQSGSTTYPYNGNDCPNDGYYVINNKTSNCFGGTWHTLTEDHTPGDNNGYMMIVNGSVDPGIFYTFSVDNLCPNTTYEFAAYVLNLIIPNAGCGIQSKPKITFRVETEGGTLIGTYSTGDINETSAPQWKKYGFFFKSPPNVSKVVLKLINDAPGGCGNDLALDDITFRPCGPTILAGTSVNTNQNTFQICEGSSANYSFEANVSSGYENPAYQWQVDVHDGNGWTDIPNSNTTSLPVVINNANINGYTYRMAAAEQDNIQSSGCRVFSNPITINVSPKLSADAGKDLYLIEGGEVKLSPNVPDNLTYQWSPATYLDNPNLKQPTSKPTQSITYTLTVTDPLTGCSAQDQVNVVVDNNLKIPDSFSPNGDGINDTWEIQGLLGNQSADVSVFNRNGQRVYHTKGYPKAWDGRLKNIPLPSGMYYYIIDTHSDVRPTYRGSVLIIY